MQISSFDDVLRFTEQFTNLEKQTTHYTTRTYRLDRMEALLKHLGNPEKSFKKIHLAGSKGKGSTASYLAASLTALGFKTGLYMSPHLSDYRERFTLSGTFFDDYILVAAGQELVDALSGFVFTDEWGETNPTTFELYTAYAFLLFKISGCDWAVIETGLGGRLDATNTIIPEASVLCPIELEHTKILGNTIAEIAGEKSKIIKEGVPVFIGWEEGEALQVFLEEAKQKHSPAFLIDEYLENLQTTTTTEGEKVTYTWKDGTKQDLCLQMRGHVQAQNTALALLVLKQLGLFDERVLPALEKNQIPGRFQQLAAKPYLYLDGAHTLRSLKALLASFSDLHPSDSNTVIFGALEDKDHTHMIELLLDHFTKIIISQPGTFKKSDIKALAALTRSLANKRDVSYDIILIEDNAEALKQAFAMTPKDSAILTCGSFYLAGGIKRAFDAARNTYESQLA